MPATNAPAATPEKTPATAPAGGPNNGAPAVAMSPEEQKAHDREVYRRLSSERGWNGNGPAGTPKPPASPPNDANQNGAAKPSQDDGSRRRELVEIANSVLKRDGLGDKARKASIDALTDDELSTMVEHRRKVQADQDRLGNKVAELERKGPAKPETGKGAPKDPPADDLSDLSERQRAMVARLRSEGDDDRANEMLEAFRDGKAPASPRRDEPKPAHGDLSQDEMARINEDRLLVRLRDPIDQIAKGHPKLKSEGDRRRLIQTADRLFRAGVFEPSTPVEEWLKVAARAAFGEPTQLDAQRALARDNAIERNGQPDTTTSANRSGTPSGKDRDRRAYQLLRQGHNAEEVRRMLESVDG